MPDFTLPYSERVRGFGAVRRLFSEGRGGFVYPFRYLVCPGAAEHTRVLFSVPKRNHKRANRRNLLRRRAKEAYRLNKSLLAGTAPAVDMAIIYAVKDAADYKTIENAVKRILAKVAEGV